MRTILADNVKSMNEEFSVFDRGGGTAFMAAVALEDWESASRLFLQVDNSQRELALTLAADDSHNAALAWLLKRGVSPNIFLESGVFEGDTPLHLATTSGNVEAVKLLLAAGADINIKSRRIRETPPGYAQHYINDDKFADEHLERIREISRLFKQQIYVHEESLRKLHDNVAAFIKAGSTNAKK
jgi:ankyrin repeat protein